MGEDSSPDIEGSEAVGDYADSATSPDDYVAKLSVDRLELEWEDTRISLRRDTVLEVDGELNGEQLKSLQRERKFASALYKRLGTPNILVALTLGLTDCISDKEWDEIRGKEFADRELQKTVEYFTVQRDQAKLPPTEPTI